jgi:stage II sporulation protein D
MKKALMYLIGFIFICFIIPAVFTQRAESTITDIDNEVEEQNEENNEQTENNDYTYQKYGTITLLHKKTGEIEEANLDEYLCNVVSAEMPATYETQALEAQAIVARTYTIFKILNKKHDNADICDDSTCCQAWISKEDRLAKWEESTKESNWQKICDAVENTKGKIVTYENQPINAFFHSNSGGTTEIPLNVWGGSGYPYLQSVQTAGEEAYSQYQSEVEFTYDEIIEKIKEKYQDISIDFSNDESIKILEYTESGRVRTVRFGNHEISGVEARTILGLKSANFEISKNDGKIKFSVIGYGHGVGMSQTGADAMAKQGSTAEEIIYHFYTGVEIKDVNSL